ncbi:glycosyltransferase family 2 protein [Haladaptatus sp. DYSN1]|uniref:glycosyltransferase n=1 Tax=unclassified Haladaptatus TaxID=2622732 RepID=UPI002405E3DF|nr:glycosyltransferase family A protein [Haladaptatus sp. DYSN1]
MSESRDRRWTYSICITHYNQGATLRSSLESILQERPADSEVVIVDAGSNDGSLSILRSFAAAHDAIRLHVEPGCNRGEGRQLALEIARGAHIIANYDLDQTYDTLLAGILEVYHDLLEAEGDIALRTAGNLFIAPRELLRSVGGYSPLMRGEDHELTDRLEDRGVLRYLPVKNTQNVTSSKPSARRRARRSFRSAKGLYQIGFSPTQIFQFLLRKHPPHIAVAGVPIFAAGILAGVLDGRVYTARKKNWREIFEMSARPTYEDIVVEIPPELAQYAVAHETRSERSSNPSTASSD